MLPIQSLSPPVLAAIAEKGVRRRFAANAIVLNEGDVTSSLYIVLSGRLKVYASSDEGRDVVLADVGPGDYFGEISLDGNERSASVVATEPTTCVVVPGAELRDFFAVHPDFAQHLVMRLISTVRRLTGQVKSFALQDVYGRLVRLMLEHSDPVGDERVLRTAFTQQDLADRIGASREMVNRVMKQLETGGFLERHDGRIVLKKKLPATW